MYMVGNKENQTLQQFFLSLMKTTRGNSQLCYFEYRFSVMITLIALLEKL